MSRNPSGLFISYSHKDKKWLGDIHTHLKPLVRRGMILWDDTHLSPGAVWQDEIDHAIRNCSAALLLVTPDFLASDFITSNELGPLLRRRHSENLPILWIHVRPSLYEKTIIVALQATHDISRPLSSLSKSIREATIANICRAIDMAVGPTEDLDESTSPSRSEYTLILSGELDELILGQLRFITGDPTLTIVKLHHGSIQLVLEGTVEGFDLLQAAFASGELERIINRTAHALYLVDQHREQSVTQASNNFRLKLTEMLTPVQRKVFDGIVSGKSYKGIAREMAIAEGTVRVHAANILRVLTGGGVAPGISHEANDILVALVRLRSIARDA